MHYGPGSATHTRPDLDNDAGAGDASRRAMEAAEVDPVVEQTRAVAVQLFVAELAAGRDRSCQVAADKALACWRARAVRNGDAGLVRILDRLDHETFAATWSGLGAILRCRGTRGILDWASAQAHHELWGDFETWRRASLN